ncbi:M20/M25/M40 family metallo-hydrolase [bacterium]|nr:M20/M25/M40 family metallo-hydrolase [bacterium]
MPDSETIHKTCLDLLPGTTAFLDRLVRFQSLSSYEGPAMEWLYDQFRDIADVCEKVPVPEDIINDPGYSFRMGDQPYEGRPNLRVVIKGDGTGKSVCFNAHVDVVPPSKDQPRPFDPYVENGAMYGRGTCDDKGQIAMLWTLLTAMKRLGVKPKGDVILHIVIEEETGGNGTLALIRRGEQADFAVNLEPTSNDVYTSVRGAVWFTGTVYGRAGHSGSAQTTVSALKMAIEAIKIIEEYNQELLEKTHGDDPLFLKYKNPMPVTFGQLEAGDWPAMAPQKAVFKGVFGLLTTPKEEVMREMVERVKTRGPEWLRDNFEMTFSYRHDTSRTDPDGQAVKLLLDGYRAMGVKSEIGSANYGADAWFYNNILGIPTVATGCGSINDAHTNHEHVVLSDIALEAASVLHFIGSWCGIKE